MSSDVFNSLEGFCDGGGDALDRISDASGLTHRRVTEVEMMDRPLSQSVIRAPGEGRPIPLGSAGVVTLKAVGDETDGALTAYEFELPPTTAGPPVHLHRTWDEVFYVLGGEMSFLIDGNHHRAPAGTFVFVPHGVLHTFWNEGTVPARQLVVFTPSGIEDYFDDLTRVLGAADDGARARAEAAMAHHDMVVPPDARPAYEPLARPRSTGT
jgi:quercetin dioxygenase-like cupin family protein